MSAKTHYENHLAHFYAWMAGNREIHQQQFAEFLQKHQITPLNSGHAIDFGAGHGLQSIPLAQTGFHVRAVDFNALLLDEITQHKEALSIETILDDIRHVQKHAFAKPELIVCCGDTLLHLESKAEVRQFLTDCHSILTEQGKLILSFRDYTNALEGNARFIPVKSDENRILTCILEYGTEKIRVTDLLYEKEGGLWKQKVSSYEKVRMLPEEITEHLQEREMTIIHREMKQGMYWVVAEKF